MQSQATASPSDGDAYNKIGDLHLKKKDYKQAIDAYLIAAKHFSKTGFPLKAVAVYKKILKLNPQRYDVSVALGDLNAQRGFVAEAVKDYLLGVKYCIQGGRVKKALEVYHKIVDLDPHNTDVRLKLAEMYLKEGFVQQAVEEHLQIAGIFESLAQKEKARAVFERILELDPLNRVALDRLNVERRESVAPVPAMELTESERMASPAESAEAGSIGQELQEVVTDFIQPEISDPAVPIAQPEPAIFFRTFEDTTVASTAQETLDDLLNAAEVFLKHGLQFEAMSYLERALELDPDNIEVNIDLKEIHKLQGRRDLAARQCRRLADLYQKEGDADSYHMAMSEARAIEEEDSSPHHREDLVHLLDHIETVLTVPDPVIEASPETIKILNDSEPVGETVNGSSDELEAMPWLKDGSIETIETPSVLISQPAEQSTEDVLHAVELTPPAAEPIETITEPLSAEPETFLEPSESVEEPSSEPTPEIPVAVGGAADPDGEADRPPQMDEVSPGFATTRCIEGSNGYPGVGARGASEDWRGFFSRVSSLFKTLPVRPVLETIGITAAHLAAISFIWGLADRYLYSGLGWILGLYATIGPAAYSVHFVLRRRRWDLRSLRMTYLMGLCSVALTMGFVWQCRVEVLKAAFPIVVYHPPWMTAIVILYLTAVGLLSYDSAMRLDRISANPVQMDLELFASFSVPLPAETNGQHVAGEPARWVCSWCVNMGITAIHFGLISVVWWIAGQYVYPGAAWVVGAYAVIGTAAYPAQAFLRQRRWDARRWGRVYLLGMCSMALTIGFVWQCRVEVLKVAFPLVVYHPPWMTTLLLIYLSANLSLSYAMNRLMAFHPQKREVEWRLAEPVQHPEPVQPSLL